MASTNISTGPISQFCKQRQRQDFLVAEDFAQLFVADLRERRIHHQDEARRRWEAM